MTDANKSQMESFWPVVEWHQQLLDLEGLTQKRGRGRPRGKLSSLVQKWVDRARRDPAKARSAFRRDWSTDLPNYEWVEADRWWRRNVQPRLG